MKGKFSNKISNFKPEQVDSESSEKPKSDKMNDEKIPVKKAKMDSISIYELSEAELDILEQGSPNSLMLNFAIFFGGIFFSFLANLLISDFSGKDKIYISYNVITFGSLVTSVITLILWIKGNNEFKQTIKRIRNRMENIPD